MGDAEHAPSPPDSVATYGSAWVQLDLKIVRKSAEVAPSGN